MTATHRPRFAGIELGRGIAASLVVFHHAGAIVAEPRFFNSQAFAGALQYLYVGVDFFFVLSGFIIAWVHGGDIGRPDRLGTYVRKRFLRIYQAYWGVLIPLILLYQIFPTAGQGGKQEIQNVLFSILLLPQDGQPILGVAWTLVHEMLFYGLFALAILWGRAWLWLGGAWTLAIILAHLAFKPLPFPASFVLSPFNLEFVMGVLAAFWLRRNATPWPLGLAVVGSAAFLGLMLFAPWAHADQLLGRLLFGGASVAFILGIVEIERRRPVVLPRPLALLGQASYAIYLVHPVALSITIHAMARLLPRDTSLAAMVVVVASCLAIVAGIAYHRLIEFRITALISACLDRYRPRQELVR